MIVISKVRWQVGIFSYPNTIIRTPIVSTSGSTNPGTSNDMSGLAFDGTNLLMIIGTIYMGVRTTC